MRTLSAKTQRQLDELEREAKHSGVEHHLRAAREMASRGKSVREIEFMTRWLFSKDAIDALRAEAAVNTTISRAFWSLPPDPRALFCRRP
jgi:hypothetical protein